MIKQVIKGIAALAGKDVKVTDLDRWKVDQWIKENIVDNDDGSIIDNVSEKITETVDAIGDLVDKFDDLF